jgi:hypothetical protein
LVSGKLASPARRRHDVAMRRILPFAAAMLLAGCASRPEEPAQVQTPAPQTKELSADLIGANAGDLIKAFGTPALQIREGSGLKLQFRGRACILDAYLYASQAGAPEKVTYVDARTSSGASTDEAQCALSLSQR